MFNLKTIIKNSLKDTVDKLKANNASFSQKMEANKKSLKVSKKERAKEWNGIKNDLHNAKNELKEGTKKNWDNLEKELEGR